MNASTTPGRTVFGKGGVKPAKVGSAKSGPRIVNYRESPVPHAKAPKAGKTGPALATYPRRPSNIATSGNPC